MYRVLALVAVALAVGVAPAFADYPIDEYDDEIDAAPGQLTATYEYDHTTNDLTVNLSGLFATANFDFTINICPDDGTPRGATYAGTCQPFTSQAFTDSTGSISLEPTTPAGDGLFVTVLAGTVASSTFTHSAQAIVNVGATSSEDTVDLPPVGTDFDFSVDRGEESNPSLRGRIDNPGGGTEFNDLRVYNGPLANASAITLSPSGVSFVYAHNGSKTTSDSFTFTVREASGLRSNPIDATVEIRENRVPVGRDFTHIVGRGVDVATVIPFDGSTTGLGTPIVTDQNVPHTTFGNIVFEIEPAHGTLGVNPEKTALVYTHTGGGTTSDTARFNVTDVFPDGRSNLFTGTFNFNQVPVVRDFAHDVALTGDTEILFIDPSSTSGQPIVSDSDGDGTFAAFTKISALTSGTVVINDDGTGFIYTVNPGASDIDTTLTFTVMDHFEGVSAQATATFNPVDGLAPEGHDVARTIDRGGVEEVAFADPSDTDDRDVLRDPNGDTTFTGFTVTTPASHGTPALNDDGSGITYTHDSGKDLSDTFSFTVNDATGTASNIVTVDVTITPNLPPRVSSFLSTTAHSGQTKTISFFETDGVGNSLVFDPENISPPFDNLVITSAASHSLSPVVFNDDKSGLVYVHDDSSTVTSDEFKFTLTDNFADNISDEATVFITIDQNPVGTDFTFTAAKGVSTTVLFSGDSDTPGTPILTNPEDVGTVKTGYSNIIVSPEPSHGNVFVNVANTGLVYEHDDSASTTDTFGFTVTDEAGARSNLITATVDIENNEPPEGTNFTRTVNKGATLNIPFSGDSDKAGTPIISDTNGDTTFTGFTVTTLAAHGTPALNDDGSGITYMHDDGTELSDTFAFTVEDSTNRVSNIVNASITINQPPVGSNFAVDVDKGQAVTTLFTADSSSAGTPILTDPNGDSTFKDLAFSDEPTHGTVTINGDGTGITYTHGGGAGTTDTFTFTVADPNGLDSGDITVQVAVAHPPVGNDFDFNVTKGDSVEVLFSTDATPGNPILSDANDDGFTNLVFTKIPTNNQSALRLNADATGFTYEHDDSDTISDEFTFRVDDSTGKESNPVTATVTIDHPPIGSNFARDVAKGATTTILFTEISSTAGVPIISDRNGGPFENLDVTNAPQHTTTALVLNGPGTGIIYKHDDGAELLDTFTFTIDDSTGLTSGSVVATLTIVPNAQPVGTDFERTIDRGATLNLLFTEDGETAGTPILLDPEGDTPFSTLVASVAPSHGTLTLDNTGTGITYVHNDGEGVSDTFTFTVTDSAGVVSDPVTGTININQAPVGTNFTRTIAHGGTANILFANDGDTAGTPILSDPNGDLTFDGLALTTSPLYGEVTANADDTGITYVHGGTVAGSDAFSFTMDDATDRTSNIINATIIINQAPVGRDFTINVARGESNTIGFDAESSTTGQPIVSDLNGDTSFEDLVVVSKPEYNSSNIVLNTAGTAIIYVHNGSVATSDSFTFRVSDTTGLESDVVKATLVVTGGMAPVGTDASRNLVVGTSRTLLFSTVVTPPSTTFVSDPDPNTVFENFRLVNAPQHGRADPVTDALGNVVGVRYTHIGTTIVTDRFTFTVDDNTGLRSNEVTFTLATTANQPPEFVQSFERTVNKGGELEVSYSEPWNEDNPASQPIVLDPENLPLANPVVVTDVDHGDLTLDNTGFTYIHDDGDDTSDSFVFTIEDEFGGATGQITATLVINQPPVGTDITADAIKGGITPILFGSSITDSNGDTEFQNLIITDGPTYNDGDVILNDDGTGIIYTHDGSDEASDSFTFTVDDSNGLASNEIVVTLTINIAPLGNGFERTINQEDTITIGFSETGDMGLPILRDPEGDTTFMNLIVTEAPTYNASAIALNSTRDGFTYEHNNSTVAATDTFSFTVQSGTERSSEITARIIIIPYTAPEGAEGNEFERSVRAGGELEVFYRDIITDPNVGTTFHNTIIEFVANGTADSIPHPDESERDIGIKYTHDGGEGLTGLVNFTVGDSSGLRSPVIAMRIEIGASGGGGDDDQQWKRKPTFGESHLTGALIVEKGFSFNGNTLDVTDNWHTDFARTSSIIGEHNTVTIKTYANDPLRRVSLSLAIPEVGALHDAETDIHVILQRNYSDASGYDIINVMHEQKEQLVNATHTTASIGPAKCTSESEDERCYEVELSFVVTAPLKHDVVAITAVDSKRYSTTTYINEGVVFEGDALLPAHTHQMTQKRGNQHPAETIQLTQQDRRFELWEDQHGFLWTKNSHDTWMRLTHPDFERPDDPEMSIKTRLHSDFASMVQHERDRALLVFDSASISSELEEPFTYEYYLRPSKLSDPEILERMHIQAELAELKYGGN